MRDNGGMSQQTPGQPDNTSNEHGGEHEAQQAVERVEAHPVERAEAHAVEPISAGADAAAPHTTSESEQVRIRRAPKLSMFLVVGGALGVIVALVLTSAFEIDPAVGFGATFGYLALYSIPMFIVVAALLALLLDWRSSRRAREVTIQHESVHGQE